MNAFKGVIIEESLQDKAVLEKLRILSTKTETVTESHNTPWLKQWTLHSIEVSEKDADDASEEIRKALDSKHAWYADFKNDKRHYIVFKDKIFKEELSTWVRSNNTKKPDGMPLSGFGVPGIISLFAPYLIKLTNPAVQANMEKKTILNSSGLLVISSVSDDKIGWLKTGKLYSFITLACLFEGISTAPFGGMIEYKEARTRLKKMLGIDISPTFFARMGYSNNSPHHSPRRNVAQLLFKM